MMGVNEYLAGRGEGLPDLQVQLRGIYANAMSDVREYSDGRAKPPGGYHAVSAAPEGDIRYSGPVRFGRYANVLPGLSEIKVDTTATKLARERERQAAARERLMTQP